MVHTITLENGKLQSKISLAQCSRSKINREWSLQPRIGLKAHPPFTPDIDGILKNRRRSGIRIHTLRWHNIAHRRADKGMTDIDNYHKACP
jgi:hypothetical protein